MTLGRFSLLIGLSALKPPSMSALECSQQSSRRTFWRVSFGVRRGYVTRSYFVLSFSPAISVLR
jgi:hypothetical protein